MKIHLCDCVTGQGECDFLNIQPGATNSYDFYLAACNCLTGYTGRATSEVTTTLVWGRFAVLTQLWTFSLVYRYLKKNYISLDSQNIMLHGDMNYENISITIKVRTRREFKNCKFFIYLCELRNFCQHSSKINQIWYTCS